MKLTKSKLVQIIKEELQKTMLDEYGDAPLGGDTEMSCKMKGGTWHAATQTCTHSEEFNETKSGEAREEKERKAIKQMKALMLNAHNFYNDLSSSEDKSGKKDLEHLRPFLIKNFEAYAQRWKEEMQEAAEEEEHEI